MSITNLVGTIASSISYVMSMPRSELGMAVTVTTRTPWSPSVTMNVLLVCDALLCTVYGILTRAFWVATPGLVNLPLTLFSIVPILKSRTIEDVQDEPWDRTTNS